MDTVDGVAVSARFVSLFNLRYIIGNTCTRTNRCTGRSSARPRISRGFVIPKSQDARLYYVLCAILFFSLLSSSPSSCFSSSTCRLLRGIDTFENIQCVFGLTTRFIAPRARGFPPENIRNPWNSIYGRRMSTAIDWTCARVRALTCFRFGSGNAKN